MKLTKTLFCALAIAGASTFASADEWLPLEGVDVSGFANPAEYAVLDFQIGQTYEEVLEIAKAQFPTRDQIETTPDESLMDGLKFSQYTDYEERVLGFGWRPPIGEPVRPEPYVSTLILRHTALLKDGGSRNGYRPFPAGDLWFAFGTPASGHKVQMVTRYVPFDAPIPLNDAIALATDKYGEPSEIKNLGGAMGPELVYHFKDGNKLAQAVRSCGAKYDANTYASVQGFLPKKFQPTQDCDARLTIKINVDQTRENATNMFIALMDVRAYEAEVLGIFNYLNGLVEERQKAKSATAEKPKL